MNKKRDKHTKCVYILIVKNIKEGNKGKTQKQN